MVIASANAEADHAFFRDVLNLPAVDAGGGYIIFGLPASEASSVRLVLPSCVPLPAYEPRHAGGVRLKTVDHGISNHCTGGFALRVEPH